jgi:transcriptional regulator with XRE-family HTH domain
MATPSFGEKLREERERRSTSIEEIAEKTKIALHFLQALERDEFDELPGRAFGKFYIRAYAEILDFDPEPLIVEYDKEQASEGGAAGPTPLPEPAKPRRVEAEIARWREARLGGQRESSESTEPRRPNDATVVDGPSDDVEPAPAGEPDQAPSVESPANAPGEREATPDLPTPVPALDRDEQDVGARYDEAAALASILGAHESAPAPSSRRRAIVASLVGLGLLAVVSWVIVTWLTSDDPAVDRPSSAVGEQAPSPSPVAPTETHDAESGVEDSPGPAASRPVISSDPPPPVVVPETDQRSNTDTVAGPPGITVPEFGVGHRIVDRRLEGRGERFEEGSVVWFQTRAVGGKRGGTIRHVWLRDGRAVQTVDLELGGSHWRTHSRKTLWGAGEWAVEARDSEGRVLARSEFVCVPAN